MDDRNKKIVSDEDIKKEEFRSYLLRLRKKSFFDLELSKCNTLDEVVLLSQKLEKGIRIHENGLKFHEAKKFQNVTSFVSDDPIENSLSISVELSKDRHQELVKLQLINENYRNRDIVYELDNPSVQELHDEVGDIFTGISLEIREIKKNILDDTDKLKRSATRFVLDDVVKSGVWKGFTWDSYTLPGQGSSLKSCHKWFNKGCLNRHLHERGDVFVASILKQCARSGCPLCFESWMNREANAMTRRITKMMEISKRKVSHVTVVFPPSMHNYPAKKLSRILRPYLKKVGIIGGSKVLHPFRFDKENKWMPKIFPHYHLICFGWIENTAEIYEKTGIIINKISTLYNETDVFRTVKYQLTHCGVKEKTHSVTYFGNISYSKLRVEKEEIELFLCPECSLEIDFINISSEYRGEPPPFGIGFTGFTQWNGFVPIDRYDLHYYDDNWNLVTTSKIMSLENQEKREKQEKKLQRIKNKFDNKSRLSQKIDKF